MAKGDKGDKDNRIRVSVTDADREAFEAIAREEERPVGDVVRRLARKGLAGTRELPTTATIAGKGGVR